MPGRLDGTQFPFTPSQLKRQLQIAQIIVLIHPVIMSSPRKSLFILLLTVVLIGLTGCGRSQENSTIPWSRPASWEGRIPGMTGN